MLTTVLTCFLMLWWFVTRKIQGVQAFLPSLFPPVEENLLEDAPYPTFNDEEFPPPEDEILVPSPEDEIPVPSPEAEIPVPSPADIKKTKPYYDSFDYPEIRGSLRLILPNPPGNLIGNLNFGSEELNKLCWRRGSEWLCALNVGTRGALDRWLRRVLGHLHGIRDSGDMFEDDPKFTVYMLIPSAYFHQLFPPEKCLVSHFRESLFRCDTTNERPEASDFGEHWLQLTGDRTGLYNSIYTTQLELMKLEGYTGGNDFILYD